MRAVWARNPITAFEIIESLAADDPGWHPKTVRTLLSRLVKKRALGYTPRGHVYFYEPLFEERECVAAASESFLDRVFGGSLQPMLAHFVERRQLTKKDLDELRRLLEEAGDGETEKRRERK